MTSPSAQTSPAPSSPVRLTRRGRIVLTFVMMVGLVIAGFTLGRGSSQAAGHHVAQPRHTVTVRAGDTLWSVAERVAPHADTRDVVAEIQSLNRLSGAVVVPGERLLVPALG
ncbi:MAG TPA: LysM peptidoglycan-binding domain-containing protein [Mycobacteriales bacterium]|nr:LysM peptidoglycan-binding domain-containing protein [Mycobacteriales bacterium]